MRLSSIAPMTVHHEEIASAGYRMARWGQARQILGRRAAQGRLSAFLQAWMPHRTDAADFIETLRFETDAGEQLWQHSGLAASARERALLHLPVLRPFWRQELRQAHFDALRRIVPPAWFLDDTPIPHGAVIAGLGIASWADFGQKQQHEHFRLVDEKGHEKACVAAELPQHASQRRWVLTAHFTGTTSFTARYQKDAEGRITLVECQDTP